ncbi:hypothetical protein EJ110_NYTH07823 [Nymphaea thermarum]|nr:hypothetical protein EJ110_NYTH07823 [Nymphaea thermarum]
MAAALATTGTSWDPRAPDVRLGRTRQHRRPERCGKCVHVRALRIGWLRFEWQEWGKLRKVRAKEEARKYPESRGARVATNRGELSSSSSSSSSEPTQPAGTEPDGAQFDRPDPLSGVVDAPQPQEVMRYLLEASDDELGIPASPVDPSPLEREGEGGEREAEAEALVHHSYVEREGIDQLDFDEKGLPSGVLERESLSYDGLWEVDDQTANYYDFLNSQLCYDDLKIEI